MKPEIKDLKSETLFSAEGWKLRCGMAHHLPRGLSYQLGADTYQHISAYMSKTDDIELIVATFKIITDPSHLFATNATQGL